MNQLTPIANLIKIAEDYVSGTGSFSEVVSCVLKNQGNIVEMTAYKHPFGFYVFQLGKLNNGAILRLHIWSLSKTEHQREEYFIHDHIYSFNSIILCGELKQKMYIVDKENKAPTHAKYQVIYGENSSTLLKAPVQAHLQLHEELGLSKGNYYKTVAGELHTLEANPNIFSSTLVCTYHSTMSNPSVYGPLTGPEEILFVREPLSYSEKKTAISYLDKLLENSL